VKLKCNRSTAGRFYIVMTGNNVLMNIVWVVYEIGRQSGTCLSASNAITLGVKSICPDRQVASSHASADVTAQEFVLYLVRFLLFQESAGMNDLRVTLQHNSGTTHLNP